MTRCDFTSAPSPALTTSSDFSTPSGFSPSSCDELPRSRSDPTSHGGAPLGALDGLGRHGRSDVVGLVLGLRLEGKEAAQLTFDLGAIPAGLAEESQHLVVVLAGRSLAETGAHTASAELIPACTARLVAAMLRPASASLVAASANSSALAA